MKPGARYIKALLAVLVLIAADQLTKHLAVVYLKGKSSVYLIKDALCFRYLENNGSAFSLMQGKQSFLILFGCARMAVSESAGYAPDAAAACRAGYDMRRCGRQFH